MSTHAGKRLKGISVFGLLASLALAPRPVDAIEMFGGIGTTGLEVGLGDRFGASTGLRVSSEFLNLSRDFERNGASYDAKLKFSTLAIYGDYFLGDRFRLTAGAQFGARKATGNAVASNGTITINGVTYPAAGESVDVQAKFPSTTPYLGIGWGHAQTIKGLSFYVDAGVLIGKADVTITPSAGLLAAAGQANIDAEERNLQESVDKLKLFPAVKFGIGYRF